MIKKYADFRFIALTRFLFSLAMQSQAVVIGWLVYELTKSPLYLGLIGLTEAVPAISLALYAGHWVDRGRPYVFYRNAILFCTVISALLMAVITLNQTELQLILLFIAIFFTGVARSFVSPALYSLIPQVVPREAIMATSAWINSFFQLASVGGPAIAGFIYALFGKVSALAFVTVTGAMASTMLMQLSPAAQKISNYKHTGESMFESIRAGIRFVYHEKVLLSALSLDMFSVLFGGATALLPVFSDQILNAGPMGLGYLRAAPAVGAISTSIFLIVRPLKVASGGVLLAVVAGFGVSMIGFGLSQTLPVALAWLVIGGSFDSVSMIIRSTLLQLCTPEHMRGRVSAVNSVFISSSNEIGAFESGVAARLLGLVPSIVFGGVMTLGVVASVFFASPGFARARVKK